MGHKTDLRRYAKSIDAVARGRVTHNAARKPAPAAKLSPEAEMLREGLGTLIVSRDGKERSWLIAVF
jgi:hypothetical protein